MTAFTLDSVRQYKELGVFTQSGGLEVARTPERMEEFKRRTVSAHSWGIDTELITPAQAKELVPYLNSDIILGAFNTPGVGVVDSLRAGTIMRERAVEMGALTISAMTEVTGLDVEDGRIKGVRTDKGDIAAETVVIACGVWSPRIARMAGASIPLTPAIHQMISVGPVPLFADTVGEIKYPDRARHGHQHVRAPARRRPGGRLVRPPPDPSWPSRSSVQSRGGLVTGLRVSLE